MASPRLHRVPIPATYWPGAGTAACSWIVCFLSVVSPHDHQEEVRQLVRARRHKMVRAYAVLQERREEGAEPVVSQANWNQLVRLVQPDISNAHRELLWSVCDDKNQGYIGNTHTHAHVNLPPLPVTPVVSSFR